MIATIAVLCLEETTVARTEPSIDLNHARPYDAAEVIRFIQAGMASSGYRVPMD